VVAGVSWRAGMQRRRDVYNPKRQILPADQWSASKGQELTVEARYGGNPEHKTRPGDYGLTPPCSPRPGKTLCDAECDFPKSEALMLLQQGIERGLVSVQMRDRWPQNIWAVSASGEVFEAQLENQSTGVYHGYPMPEDDDFRLNVVEKWHARGF